jgi:hypothetical protein
VVFTGADVGTTFPLRAARSDGSPHEVPALTLTREARHLAFMPQGGSLVLLRGEIRHKNRTGVSSSWNRLRNTPTSC